MPESGPDTSTDNARELVAPSVPAALPDVPGGDINLIPASALAHPLKVTFPLWQNSLPSVTFPERVRIFLDDDEVADKQWTVHPIQPEDLFINIPIDKVANRQGARVLHYDALNWSGDPDDPTPSYPVTITIDTRPPILAGASKMQFPPEILPPAKITARYLNDPAHNDQVLATVPDYNEKKVGDVIVWYWEEFPDGLAVVDTKTLDIDDLGKPLELVFPGEMLRDRKNGQRYATYRVFDRAGNATGLSSRETLQVDIQPPPLRKHPTVKEAQNGAGTGQLDTQFYGVSGVTVVVPRQDDASPGDKLEVYWNGYGDLGSHYAPLPNPADPLQFPIPAKAIPANIGADRHVEIRYTVTPPGFDPEWSDPFKLTLKAIPLIRFMKIDCPLAARGSPLKLKLSAVPPDGTLLTLAAWVYQADTQLINIWLTDANSRREDIRVAWPVTMGTNRAILPKTFLSDVRINSVFAVHVSVSFDGGDSYLAFPSQDIQLLD
jgi:hypothetical protein